MKRVGILFVFLLLFLTPLRSQPKELYLWHAFDGFLAQVFEEICEDFNHHSGNYKIIPVYKGNYTEVVEKALDAHENKENFPHIFQGYEVATQTLMLKKGVCVPIGSLMKQYHKKFDPDVYIDAVRKFYSTSDGKMLSFPWNASTGILFYNKDAFVSAGLDPERPPKTWPELEEMGKKLTRKGYKGFTTAWPAAYHLEHVSCWHNLPFATHGNGFDSLKTRFVFNSPERAFHLSKIAEWQNQGIFSYSGRFSNEPENKFSSQECAILLQGANRLPLIQRKSNFSIGVGFMPYWPHIAPRPYNMNIGGASFWVMNGFKNDEYRGIVQFFEYLSSTEIQAFWHQKTGYLPITDAAYYLTKKKGFYKENPAAEIAVLEVMQNSPTVHSQGLRFGNYIVIREMIIDNLERAILGEVTPQEALDNAVDIGNQYLEAFEKEHGWYQRSSEIPSH